jgi:cytochrome bd ubiquinol oxidase subunit II
MIARRVALVALRSVPPASGRWSSLLFACSSLLVAFSQGVAVTAVAEWTTWTSGTSGATAFDFLSWYSVLGGVTAIAVYAVAGAVWAAHKADGPVQQQALRVGAMVMPVAAGLVALSAALLPAPPALQPGWDVRLVFVAGAVLVGSTMGVGWSSQRSRVWLVAAAIVAVEVVVLGVIVGLRLAEMLPRPTNSQIGAPTSALYYLLIAIAPCMPVVLFLNGYALWRFCRELVPSRARSIAAAPVGV